MSLPICAERSKKSFKICKTRLSQKAEEIQGYADNYDMRRFYDALKCLYGPQSSKNTPILSADGSKLITDKKGVLDGPNILMAFLIDRQKLTTK